MTARERLAIEHPEYVDDVKYVAGCCGCPRNYGYFPGDRPIGCPVDTCGECWDREIPDTPSAEETEGLKKLVTVDNYQFELDGRGGGKVKYIGSKGEILDDTITYSAEELSSVVDRIGQTFETSEKDPNVPGDPPDGDFGLDPYKTIFDSLDARTPVEETAGNWQREFKSGAVRDIQDGEGRCDLLPLDVVALYIEGDPDRTDFVLWHIDLFQKYGQEHYLFGALVEFANKKHEWRNQFTMFLEVSKHFEEDCKRYGENNWQKGIPVHYYIDSAIRHYLKFLRGDKDEPHDRAFCWNILCAVWTCKHKPELNDYAKKVKE